MCQNIFANNEEKQRKEVFTRLFVTLAANTAKNMQQTPKKVVRK